MEYEKAWLDYSRGPLKQNTGFLKELFVIIKGELRDTGSCTLSAVSELKSATFEFNGSDLLYKEISVDSDEAAEQKAAEYSKRNGSVILYIDNKTEGIEGSFKISFSSADKSVVICGKDSSGLLYGAFRCIILLETKDVSGGYVVSESPSSLVRMLDHWDNMDGSIERGYSGKSFFFKNNEIIINERTRDYLRLIASCGINAVAINNVNVKGPASKLIASDFRLEIKELSELFAAYGIKLFISVNFASPITLGGLNSADPLDPGVVTWWKENAAALYRDVPKLGGFLVKADSEGRPGPFSYGRDHADGANMLADVLLPHGGIVIWRCFVYNCQQDWRDRKTDRARACYDNFIKLDGLFRDNVVLQIKNGPMDFQIREPITPLFGALKKTNCLIEFQIAQEYTGQQKDICYLIPDFKRVLETRTYCADSNDKVLDVVTGKTYGNSIYGMCAVSNTGDDQNWTGHDFAAANLYGFGRLAFNPALSSDDIAKEWSVLTFGKEEALNETVVDILKNSSALYEKYTVPLGIGWMVNPDIHYGPNVEGYEFSPWGTYHRADCFGLGVERGKTGTGYAQQYNEPLASLYDSLDTCPEELLLFFHYVRYDYVLKSGKTLIQHIYDTHFEGVDEVENMIEKWKSVEEYVDKKRFERVSHRMQLQLANAIDWRDRINTYFYRKSGIGDEKGRTIY